MEKNKEVMVSTTVFYILFMLSFVAIGLYCGLAFHDEENDLLLFINLALCYPIYLVTIMLHELGHMVCGLISGYKFSSFRVFSFMILNNNAKLVFRKMKIAGTAGQCIMLPKDKNAPYVLYNLGGVLFNIIFLIISVILFIITKNAFVKVIWFDFCVFNLFNALVNGIPLKLFVSNDMNNILEYKKDPKNLENFYNTLYLNNAITLGKRLKDIGKEYIYKPKELKSTGDVNAMVFYCNQLMDKGDFKKTINEIEGFINNDKLNMVYRGLLINDLIYCYIILDKDIDKALAYKDDNMKNVLKQMKDNPSVIRTNYAYALLILKDEEKAKGCLDYFNKIKKNYPYQVEIDSELELIELARKKDH